MAFIPFPSGTTLEYLGATAPSGWLLCDGSAISRTKYPGLFTALGTTYGTGDGSTTFNLPDMRGVFPRGAGTNGTANYGGVTGHTPAGGALGSKGGMKTAKNGLAASAPSFTGSSATSLGSDLTHNHTYTGVYADGWQYGGGTYNNVRNANQSQTTNNNSGNLNHSHSLTATGTNSAPTVTGDTETTPAFIALNYIVKI